MLFFRFFDVFLRITEPFSGNPRIKINIFCGFSWSGTDLKFIIWMMLLRPFFNRHIQLRRALQRMHFPLHELIGRLPQTRQVL